MQPSPVYQKTSAVSVFLPPEPVVIPRPSESYSRRGEVSTASSDDWLKAYLTFSNPPGWSPSQTSVGQMAIGREQIMSLLNQTLWRAPTLTAPAEERALEQQIQLEQAVVSEFGAIPEVALIYSDRFRAERIFTIFMEGDQYDDDLMDHLLDREVRLVKRFSARLITFHYQPYIPGAPRRELIRESAHLIFGG